VLRKPLARRGSKERLLTNHAGTMAEKIKGYMTVKVEEASGKNKRDEYKWDGYDFEGFVKVEIRGGPRNVKVQSKAIKVEGSSIYWNEDLVLEVLEGATELRLILCRKKLPGSSQSSVIAACGIYMNDIMEAVPIDKYFELFKPGQGGDGGFIRVGMTYAAGPTPPVVANAEETQISESTATEIAKRLAEAQEEEEDEEDEGLGKKMIIVGGGIAVASLVGGVLVSLLRGKKRDR